MDSRKWWILICFVCSPLIVRATVNLRPWRYECDSYQRCVKKDLMPETATESSAEYMSLGRCKLTCDPNGVLWPRPRKVRIGDRVTLFRPVDVGYSSHGKLRANYTDALIKQAIDEQMGFLMKKMTEGVRTPRMAGVLLDIEVNLLEDNVETDVPRIRKKTDESYKLKVDYDDSQRTITATITAKNYFGARHGVETLFQLMEFDDAGRHFIISSDVDIDDSPEFPHRGVSVDTSRNFIAVDVLKDIVRGLAHSKLNVLHLHLTDTHAYPVEQLAEPINRLTQFGAYSPDEVYTQKELKELVQFANERGVRIVPEFDQPAHVGNGWQALPEDYTVCLNAEPWYDYCVEPPCGQLNPVNKDVIGVLEKIYKEWYDIFQYDTFHLGADEVNLNCYNSSKVVTDYMKEKGIARDEHGFIQIWSNFMANSLGALTRAVPPGKANELDFVVWTSHLTQEKYIDNISPKDFTVHIWTNGSDVADPQIKLLADKGYQMIFSNYDALYLDCGYGAWVGEGNNWCSPYKGWQKIYSNDLYQMLVDRGVNMTAQVKDLVLGGEVAMWTEQVDSSTIEGKIFPRAAALAERLWTNPSEKWYEAEQRMLQQRWRLTHRGVNADRLQPEWCRQNGGKCYWKDDSPFVAPKEDRHEDENSVHH